MVVVQLIRPLEGHLEGLFVFVPLDPRGSVISLHLLKSLFRERF